MTEMQSRRDAEQDAAMRRLSINHQLAVPTTPLLHHSNPPLVYPHFHLARLPNHGITGLTLA
jgi:hypothetical protein